MGMIACFAPVDEKTLAELRAEPEQIEDFLYPEDGESEPEHYIDLDKAWHCIHFMLCGEVDTNENILSQAILGGTGIGEEIAYGPARFIEAAKVREIAVALTAIDAAAFKARYDVDKIEESEVYLSEICSRDDEDAFEYLLENYLELVAFYQEAAERGDAVLAWLG